MGPAFRKGRKYFIIFRTVFFPSTNASHIFVNAVPPVDEASLTKMKRHTHIVTQRDESCVLYAWRPFSIRVTKKAGFWEEHGVLHYVKRLSTNGL